MALNLSEILLPSVARSRLIIEEVWTIQAKIVLNDSDMKRLAELKIELREFCPPSRYGWYDGIPVIDLWAAILEGI